ncbi:TPA: ParB N-terminal domain-containing protein [Pseudomonas aeruginosa]
MLQESPIQQIELSKLNLDASNPRFGIEKGRRANQTDILDFIVENFGIDDVISSLAYNGYFDAEPVIARETADGTYTVVEGNRRLAACLVLAGSPRAKNQSKLTAEFAATQKNRWQENTTIPVHVFQDGEDLTRLHAYLGVRHIMSAKAWDSYAKAAWIDDVVSRREMTLEQIAEVTGDKNRTIQRLLEGYYFVNQVRDEGYFQPDNSLRKGRGSNPEFPFSWVYTLLDYSPVRTWLELEEDRATDKKPIKASRIKDAAATLRYMFGDRASATNAAIKDSRQLGQLAIALSDPMQREWLSQGKTITEIEELSRAPVDQLTRVLDNASMAFAQAGKIVASGQLTSSEVDKVLPQARSAANQGVNVFKQLQQAGEPSIPE